MTDIHSSDVIVVGAGVGGLLAALKLAPLRVTVVAKAPMGEGAASAWAQGGIAAAMAPDDTPADHALDTLATAQGLGVDEAIALLTEEGPARIGELIELGVAFDRNADGQLTLGREGAHRHRRILHAQGDSTGRELMRALGAAVRRAQHIEIHSGFTAHSLVRDKGRVIGVCGEADGTPTILLGRAVILATGGIGALFKYTTNPAEATGDGVAMAARAGARIADPEFVQFHPTAIDVGVSPMPLATEALRGEGAVLTTGDGHRFMVQAHEDAELAPRDVVARAIWRQRQRGRKVFLDARDSVGADFPNRFPTVFAHCRTYGIDPRVQPIPVAPAAHYHMGGVLVDPNGRSSVPGLWACGEVAATGIHGANRLASNSLLEAVVFAPRAAADILARETTSPSGNANTSPLTRLSLRSIERRQVMSLVDDTYAALGLMRDGTRLRAFLQQIVAMENDTVSPSAALTNRITVLKMMTVSALARQESRGGHFRTDFPRPSDAFARRTITTLNDTETQIAHILRDEFEDELKQA